MKKSKLRFAIVIIDFLSAVLLPLLAQGREEIQSYELICLKSFIKKPDDNRLKNILPLADNIYAERQRSPELWQRAQQLLRDAFRRQWLGPSQGQLTLGQFDRLAAIVPPFGPKKLLLLQLLQKHPLPRAWNDKSFCSWLRQHLPPSSANQTMISYLSQGVGLTDVNVLKRYAFLGEVANQDQVALLRVIFARKIWSQAGAKDINHWHRQLNQGIFATCKHFCARQESGYIYRQLGQRLLAMSLSDCYLVNAAALQKILRQPSFDGNKLLRKALTTSLPNAAFLRQICSQIKADSAFDILEPAKNCNWFKWLQANGILPVIHKKDQQTLDKSVDIVKQFVTQGHLPALFAYLKGYYYQKRNSRTFAEIIRPQARHYPQLILAEANRGKSSAFFSKHRALLARDCLGQEDALGKAWTASDSPARLQLAINIYTNLLNPRHERRQCLIEHSQRPLLEDILSQSLAGFSRQPDQLTPWLNSLTEHLKICRKRGIDITNNQYLQKMANMIIENVDRQLQRLNWQPHQGVLGKAEMQALDSAVARLVLLFRLRTLLRDLFSADFDWTAKIRHTLRQKVFAITDSKTTTRYWSTVTTRFRYRLLHRLDQPLRDCLKNEPEERERFFRELYLPLVSVHGFLKVARQCHPETYPYRQWIEHSSKTQKIQMLHALFVAIKGIRWVDGEDVVCDWAREDLQLHFPGQDYFHIHPSKFFQGHWSVNANLRVYQRLLNSATTQLDDQLDLEAIAAQIIAHLDQVAIAPGFPRNSDLPLQDRRQSRFVLAPWALHLVTAAEWKHYPFYHQNGGKLDYRNRIHLRKRTDRSSDQYPFVFELRGDEFSRRVDGSLRYRLLEKLYHAWTTSPRRDLQRLLWLAEIASFLPNHSDNLLPVINITREDFIAMRQKLYNELYKFFSPEIATQAGMQILYRMMWLRVSTRDSSLTPAFSEVIRAARQWARDDGIRKDQISMLFNQMTELLEILKGKNRDDLECIRQALDYQLKILNFCGCLPERRFLIARDFSKRLATLDDSHIILLLKLKKHLRRLLAYPHRLLNYKDLIRLEKILSFWDYMLFYSRPDFDVQKYLQRVIVINNKRWWPALVALAFFDSQMQQAALKLCQRIKGYNQLKARIRRYIFMLNEAIVATIDHITNANSWEMLDFCHQLRWHRLDFKILAERKTAEPVTGASLGETCWPALLTNFRLLKELQPASDAILWETFFGSISKYAPPSYRRKEDIAYNLDKGVSQASKWSGQKNVPPKLKIAAQSGVAMLKTMDLLGGAQTPQGVMRVLYTIVQPRAQKDQQYQQVYDEIFTRQKNGKAQFSAKVFQALTVPFYRADIADQQEYFAKMLANWREFFKRKNNHSYLAKTLRCDLARILVKLLKGHRPDNSFPPRNYIWKAADALKPECLFTIAENYRRSLNKSVLKNLRNEFCQHQIVLGAGAKVIVQKTNERWFIKDKEGKGYSIRAQGKQLKVYRPKKILQEPPQEFLQLARWFFSLKQDDDPEEIGQLFKLTERE